MRVSNIRYNGDCETYQILGGEAISIDLKSGDSVEIVDVEGDQKCSVLAFDSKKSSALSSLNWNTKPKNNSNKISSGDCSEMLKAILNGKKIKSKE
ncbi:MAG: aminomethyltransferase, partial [Gammaproteobacteria bacterium]|nr:aminomethyltransferase [Gammaproteobacteria bacterium]